ncbi:MAG: HD domain-containing protein [Nitrospirota bacterium]
MPKAAELKEGDLVEEVFQVKRKGLYTSQNGNPYLSMRLSDRTGEIEGRLWSTGISSTGSSGGEGIEDWTKNLTEGDFLKIKGKVIAFKGHLQINIKEMNVVQDVDIREFLPVSARDIGEMVKEVRGYIGTINDPYLHKLLDSFFGNDEFMSLFKKAPAAKEIHHVYLGGLLEHTLEVTKLCLESVNHFKNINRDLLVAGALLHDIGKVYEFSYDRFIDYSTQGRLLGHIAIGVGLLEEKVREIKGFPGESKMLLEHLIISHHGENEYGSPIVPKTVEALILYSLDNLNAKVNCFQSFMEREGTEEGKWTSYHKILERHLYRSLEGQG